MPEEVKYEQYSEYAHDPQRSFAPPANICVIPYYSPRDNCDDSDENIRNDDIAKPY